MTPSKNTKTKTKTRLNKQNVTMLRDDLSVNTYDHQKK